jgi:hypothetical protein
VRRFFLLALGPFALLAFAVPLYGADSAPAGAMKIGSQRQLFVDDWIVDQTQNIQRQPAEVVKNPGNPILKRDKPWDQGRCDIYGSGVFNPITKQLQVFYSAFSYSALSKSQGHDERLAYAVSNDMGASWTKPDLGLVPFEGDRHTNLLLLPVPTAKFIAGPSVFFDAHETDPAKRYKMFDSEYGVPITNEKDDLRKPAAKDKKNYFKISKDKKGVFFMAGDDKIGMFIAYSPDGIHWTRPFTHPVSPLISDTTQSAFWDARLGKYVAYVRGKYISDKGRIRSVGRMESADFETWSEPQLVLRPKRQVYSMGVTPYQDVYIGTPWTFDNAIDEHPSHPVMWPELAVSRDGIQWAQPFEGQPLISTGPAGSADSAQIRMSSSLIVLDDKIVLIYGQTNRGHITDMRVDVGMATMRLDGFAAMTAGDAEGTILTKPLQFDAGRLCINAKVVPGGHLVAELLDAEGKALVDYEAASCVKVQGDMLRAPVAWNAQTTVPRSNNGVCRIRFRLQNAKLYSFWIEPSGT